MSLKDLAKRVKSNPGLIQDAEIISERKRPVGSIAEEVAPIIKKRGLFSAARDFLQASRDQFRDGWQRATHDKVSKQIEDGQPESVKDALGSLARDTRSKLTRENVIGSAGEFIAKGRYAAKDAVMSAIKNPGDTIKGAMKGAAEHLSGGIFTKKEPDGEAAAETNEHLEGINDKLANIQALLTNESKGMHLLANKMDSIPQSIKLLAPRLSGPGKSRYAPRLGSGLKKNDSGFGRVIDVTPSKNRLSIPDLTKNAQNTSAASPAGGLIEGVANTAKDFITDKVIQRGAGMAGRLGLTALRAAGPVAAVAGAGYAGYKAGEWLNEKMDAAEDGSVLAKVRDAKNSAFDTVLSGADALTGGAISGDAEQAKKNWQESAGGKAWSRVKESVKEKQLALANAFSGSSEIKGLNTEQTKAYAGNTAYTESGGKVDSTNQYGFAGQYQFGADALASNGFMDKGKLDAAKAQAKAAGKSWYKDGVHKQFMEDGSNWTNEGGRDAFMKDKKMQDDLFVKYTNKNVDAGLKSGAINENSSPEEIAAYAKAAHLKGARGANDFFLKGRDSADANGTAVSKYAAGAADSMSNLSKLVKKDGEFVKAPEVSRDESASPGADLLAKVNDPVLNSEVVETKTHEAAQVSSQPLVVPVPVQPAPAAPVQTAMTASRAAPPMSSRNGDTSIQRITAGQMCYGTA